MNEYSKISPTAKITAYWKSFSDIPFAKEIAKAIHAEETTREMLGEKTDTTARFSPPILEARYKAISAGIKRVGAKNVIELAYGLSPRGLELAAEGISYVGTDLPEILSQTQPVIHDIAVHEGLSDRIRFREVNVLDYAQLEAVAQLFNGEPFCFCNEGLIMYLNMEEKAQMAKNIRRLLAPINGSWVTTDVMFSNIRQKLFALATPETRQLFKSALGDISNQVSRNIEDNLFADEAEAIAFYNELGFDVELYPFYDGSYPLSAAKNWPDDLRAMLFGVLREEKSWILRPRG